jgi:hypothetical protein
LGRDICEAVLNLILEGRTWTNPRSTTANIAQYGVDQVDLQSPTGDSPEDEDSFARLSSISFLRAQLGFSASLSSFGFADTLRFLRETQKPLNSRRQTRRHSSNPRSTTANIAQYGVDQVVLNLILEGRTWIPRIVVVLWVR